MKEIDPNISKKFQRSLLRWFTNNKRELPWRDSKSPYKIWLSEIMLQQTRVDTVIPYYQKFLKKYPTIASLAKADLQGVLKTWEGLGYYSRIRNMRKAAKIIIEKYDGNFPDEYSQILKLPGIGPYTAGAICSIMFDQPRPVVDGNVIRVLARYFGIETDATTTDGKNEFWQVAEKLIPTKQPGAFNEALMELGALICTPKKPDCEFCPVRSDCVAKKSNRQEELPIRKKKLPTPHYDIGAGLIWKNDLLLITKRKEKGLLGGFWEFPGGKQELGENISTCVKREIEEELGIQVDVEDSFAIIKHAYTHFRITLQIYNCKWTAGEPVCKECVDFRWVRLNELDNFPFPRANKKVVERLQELFTKSS
ncbi:A/G-specific adenine glycosylase [candidate division KSB1 bacterium]|nr:A/G-specific adenine glycosylase [candidate division KSB1 bacterium]